MSLLASQAHQHHGHLINFWCFWQCGQVPHPAGKWNQHLKNLVSRRKHEELQNVLVNGCSDVGFQKTQWTNTSRWHCTPNHHRLWKLNIGLQATWAMSFSTLPPDSRTLVSKWNTKLALIWKEDFGPLGNSPVLLLLSPGKTPLTTTVAKFLDTSVCGALDALTPASVHSLWSSPKFLNRFCLIQLWWIEIITIKRTKDLNYFSLCALNLFNTRVSQFKLIYWNKWTFPQHSNLLRFTCIFNLFLNMLKSASTWPTWWGWAPSSTYWPAATVHITSQEPNLSCYSLKITTFALYLVVLNHKKSNNVWNYWNFLMNLKTGLNDLSF